MHSVIFFYLFFIRSLFIDELVENSPVLLVKLLHLVDVARHFVHGLHCNFMRQRGVIVNTRPYTYRYDMMYTY